MRLSATEIINLDTPLPKSGNEMTTGAPSTSVRRLASDAPLRPAWIEINLRQLRRNFDVINEHRPAGVGLVSVVKDDGYGHGGLQVAKMGLSAGASFLALSTVDEALSLRSKGIQARILLLGDRQESELPSCLTHDLTCCVSEASTVSALEKLAAGLGKCASVHLKINTGMNRYGVHWSKAAALAKQIAASPWLQLEGALTHFAQSDESDKTFALLQLSRFEQAMNEMRAAGLAQVLRHTCNSGGFLDLPQAHHEMVRLGILPLGVYPSSVCRRLPGIGPVMAVKARVAAIQHLDPGDHVGYGMRFTAQTRRRIAVLPIGYGDGFPRVRNQGCALIHGHRAPLVGGVAMDALTVDITDIPQAQLWDEAVLMGRQGNEEITVHDLAKLKNSVSYDVLTSWRGRLPRVYLPDSIPA